MQVDTSPTKEPVVQSQISKSTQSSIQRDMFSQLDTSPILKKNTRTGSLSPNLDSDIELISSGWSKIPMSSQVRRDLTDSAAFSTRSLTSDRELDFGSSFVTSPTNIDDRDDTQNNQDTPLSLIDESILVDESNSERVLKKLKLNDGIRKGFASPDLFETNRNQGDLVTSSFQQTEKDDDLFDFEVGGIKIANSAYKLPQTVSLREIMFKRDVFFPQL
ncbi:hypothetical protein HK100_004778 [Physocladia obscura]|uniref:Uncharacterized protein n=1 Tax=Physocladia obscura TaxID=109957 RepID=A0AAD5XCS7_9FUNG|nr:hypothetical protein HK100_004778 [Physocladia obscura]